MKAQGGGAGRTAEFEQQEGDRIMGNDLSKVFTSGAGPSPGFFGAMEVRKAERDAVTAAGIEFAGHQLDTLREALAHDRKKTRIAQTGEQVKTAVVVLGDCIDVGIEVAAGNEYKAMEISKLLEAGSESIRRQIR
jgi:hypothetical protein